MSKPVVVTIPHSLGKAEAARRLRRGLSSVSDTLSLITIDEESWSGDDSMTFRVRALGQPASGRVDIGEASVRLELVLPLLLQKMAEMAQKVLQSRGQILLEKK